MFLPRLLVGAAFLCIGLLAAGTAYAETERFALLIGHNVGNGDRDPLSYAEADAGKLARVLADVGGVKEENVLLLQGQSRGVVVAAMAGLRERVAGAGGRPGTRSVVIFYYSGHSDGVALELGDERLRFREVKEWLESTGADVRLLIVDSCKSGGMIAAKGARAGPDFDIRLQDELHATGEVILTSSAADEIALESREIGGSFFTHHLISAMRGAADVSGDGRVTLSEAYRYTYAKTVRASGNTLAGAQHPGFDYRLSGRGHVILADLRSGHARVRVPRDIDRALVVNLHLDQVEAELPKEGRRQVAVAPGKYAVYVWQKERPRVAVVEVTEGETVSLASRDFAVLSAGETAVKGGHARLAGEQMPRWSVSLSVGGGAAVGDGPGGLGLVGARLERRVLRAGFTTELALETAVSTGRGAMFRETHGRVALTGGAGLPLGRVTPYLRIGPEVGWIRQAPDSGEAMDAGAFGARGEVGVRARLTPRWELYAEGAWSQLWLQIDQSVETEGLWSTRVGAGLRF